jgi:predicted AAA+ superfamily ATPase
MQNELRQVTPAQIKGKTFKAITVVENKNKILVFFDDGSFLVENRSYKLMPQVHA